MKQRFAMLMTLVLALCLVFSACGSNGATTPTTASTTASAATAGNQATAAPGGDGQVVADDFTYPMEPVTLTINMTPIDYSTVPDWAKENYGWDMLEERTGVKLERIGSASNAIDMSDEFLLLLASGDYPDMIQCCWASGFPGGPAAAIADGYIILLDDYVDSFPLLMGYMEENPAANRAFRNDEGNIYCFPKINIEEVGTGPVVRQDWLDQFNLDVPETVDDWYTCLQPSSQS